jgi:hypothetical protein
LAKAGHGHRCCSPPEKLRRPVSGPVREPDASEELAARRLSLLVDAGE